MSTAVPLIHFSLIGKKIVVFKSPWISSSLSQRQSNPSSVTRSSIISCLRWRWAWLQWHKTLSRQAVNTASYFTWACISLISRMASRAFAGVVFIAPVTPRTQNSCIYSKGSMGHFFISMERMTLIPLLGQQLCYATSKFKELCPALHSMCSLQLSFY